MVRIVAKGTIRMVEEFDLNIEKILENWKVYHAVREIIANALDEQKLTETKDIRICKDDGVWHITDYGRGLNYHHLITLLPGLIPSRARSFHPQNTSFSDPRQSHTEYVTK